MSMRLHAVELASNPLITIMVKGTRNLGQEFFRWEFATAVAGSIMGINPFNQPDVEAAKIEARKITDEYEKTGSLPDERPFFEEHSVSLFSSDDYAATLVSSAGESSMKRLLNAHIERIVTNDYYALLAYVAM